MSFSWNPFKHIELIEVPEHPSYWGWHCESCGADSWQSASRPFSLDRAWNIDETTLQTIMKDFFQHIIIRHRLSPEEIDDWSRW